MQPDPTGSPPATAAAGDTMSADTHAALTELLEALQRLTSLPPAELARESARLRDSCARPVLSAVHREAVIRLLKDNAEALPSAQIVVAALLGKTPQAISKIRTKGPKPQHDDT